MVAAGMSPGQVFVLQPPLRSQGRKRVGTQEVTVTGHGEEPESRWRRGWRSGDLEGAGRYSQEFSFPGIPSLPLAVRLWALCACHFSEPQFLQL